MEKAKVGKKTYGIQEIRYVSPHVLKITFSEDLPEEYEGIRIYTAGGIECARFPGFTTVYRREGKIVWLSDDGSIYEDRPQPPPAGGEALELTLGETKERKIFEINSACREVIQRGIDVGGEHYSLTEVDQINLLGVSSKITTGEKVVPYHADEKLCRYYTPEEIIPVITAATKHVAYHTTYCNSMHAWVRGCKSSDEVKAIYYGADIPEPYRNDVLKAYLKEATS